MTTDEAKNPDGKDIANLDDTLSLVQSKESKREGNHSLKKIIPIVNSVNSSLYEGKWEEVISPYSGETIGRYSPPTADQIEITLQKSLSAFAVSSKLIPFKRAEILYKVSDIILNKLEDFAKLICLEVGKPIKQSRLEVRRTVDILKLTAEECLRIGGEFIPLHRQASNAKRLSNFVYSPMGVVLAITPFNFPLSTVAHKIAPALAAGNSIVLKPSPSAPLTAYNFAEAFWQAGFPSECLQVLNCSDNQTERLAQDYRIKMVNFTGSSSVGWNLRNLIHPGTRIMLELGGNSPVIVHRDADLNKALPACLRGAFAFSGQSCISVQRIYIHENIFDEFIDIFTEATNSLIVGDPENEETDIGPLIKDSAIKKINLWVEEAVSEGAKLLTGGQILANNCYAPTILKNVKPKMNIMCYEAFAPIVNIISYKTIEAAIEMANNTNYGLSAGLFTQDLDLAFSTAQSLNAGAIMINDSSSFRADEMPISPSNQSGIGIESPKYAIEEMSNKKVISVNL